MLKKRAFQHQEGEFLSQIFLVGKKNGGNRPVINLKNFNKFVSYQHFKMPKMFITESRLYVQNRFKRCMFQCAAKQGVPEISNFLMGRKLVLGLVPRALTKLLKVPMSVLRHLMIWAIILPDDLLIFGNTMEAIFVARDSVIFLLQHLGFVINFKKCVLETTQEIDFLGMIVNPTTITLSLPQQKVQKIKSQCLEVYRAQEITLLELTRLLGTLNSTI